MTEERYKRCYTFIFQTLSLNSSQIYRSEPEIFIKDCRHSVYKKTLPSKDNLSLQILQRIVDISLLVIASRKRTEIYNQWRLHIIARIL